MDSLLPLFPLQTVLFPNMPLRLHVFEERYRELVKLCLDERRPFGVTLIREGTEVGPPAAPNSVGTLARIRIANPLPDGRYVILAVGTERFRLLDYIKDAKPYLVGITEPMRDEPGDPLVLNPLIEQIQDRFRAFVTALVKRAGIRMPAYDLPRSPEELSFVVASAIPSDSARREALLEMTDTAERLRMLQTMAETEISRLEKSGARTVLRAQRIAPEALRRFISPN